MSQDQIDSFVAITSAENGELAKHFIEMAGGDLETAIALFFEHGGNSQLGIRGNDSTSTANSNSATHDDGDMAQRLQEEAYRNDEEFVRPPEQARHETLADTHVFPGTYGGIGGSYNPLRRARDMFDDSRPSGVFNQRLNEFMDEDSDSDSSTDGIGMDSDDDGSYEYVEESVIELDEDGEVREYTKMVRRPKAMSREEKLALLFRPPFDLMTKTNLDNAKIKARKKNEWMMINIQDAGIFQCQALNRDLWSSKDVKRLIKPNFVFLQYQYESRNAQPYVNFYGLQNKDDLPHIAILDPMTGERLKQWNRTVPTPEKFIEDVNEFLESFSLDPKAANPTVKEPTPDIDPTTLTEEQQMDLAIKQSLGNSPTRPVALDTENEHHESMLQHEAEHHAVDAFDSIQPIKHEEPPNQPGVTTRIQVRTGDGRRIVRRFKVDDTVRTIYEVIKSEVDAYNEGKFTLSNHQRENLIDSLDLSIGDAGLKNSSLLLEKVEEED